MRYHVINSKSYPCHTATVEDCRFTDHCDSIEFPSKSQFQRPFPAGDALSDHVSEGDFILYDGQIICVTDFDYERALLSYVVKGVSESGDDVEVFIHDDDWYHSSKIMLVGDAYNVMDFTVPVRAGLLNYDDVFTVGSSVNDKALTVVSVSRDDDDNSVLIYTDGDVLHFDFDDIVYVRDESRR